MSQKPIEELINELSGLPGIGEKTAQRLAYYILDLDEINVKKLSDSIINAKLNTKRCSICCNFTDGDPCSICSDLNRDSSTICIVEYPKDVLAMERTGAYHGLYHVLHGTIKPLRGVSPDDLTISELIKRLSNPEIKEIIVATNPTTDGDTTAMYLKRLLSPLGIKTTRIAYGIPVGGDLQYYDEVTISTALNNRQEI
ncbi:recombination protein RecR [Peptoniphilus koenoeneniae]|uniref:Recombination protein RecR n=1 Tax=Peptoniphilus koenoeneniae TaxID=507751 RepID=A0ABU0ATU2_9FIRM|nr:MULTISPECIES: recombination mediator RecR [Peptoniphilus]ERT59021.1 recombination protein RecR [Peptoniphilus sp. BV3C26]MDQ0274425.1 recombination protein RecR [Peptoniphilus koenoeneniae]